MVDVNFRQLTARLVEQAHTEKLRCVVWTVNRATDIRRMLKWGVDGITTDFPDKAMKERDEG
jgi:glycerophosphoryl diester phosphodiesterase